MESCARSSWKWILMLVMLGKGRVSSDCDSDWLAFGGHCYRLYGLGEPIPGGALGARLLCREAHSDLVTIRSQAEQDFVGSLFGMAGQVANEAYIGLSDAKHEGTFRWLDESDVNYFKWGTGEPNNWYEFSEENCVSMRRDPPHTWLDVPCITNPRGINGCVCETRDGGAGTTTAGMGHFANLDKGGYFAGFGIVEDSLRSKYDCLVECSTTGDCLSANFKSRGVGTGTCILNNASRFESRAAWLTGGRRVDGVIPGDWDYIEMLHPGV